MTHYPPEPYSLLMKERDDLDRKVRSLSAALKDIRDHSKPPFDSPMWSKYCHEVANEILVKNGLS